MNKEKEEPKSTGAPEELGNFIKWVTEKEPRLPKSIREHIARLKSQGEPELASRVRRASVEEKLARKQRTMSEELERVIYKLLETTDERIQAEFEVRAMWLLNVTGQIDSQRRRQEITELLDSRAPHVIEYIQGRMPQIRDEYQNLIPPQWPRRN